jgi:tetratricopeptide (TPR) repeat protein
LSLELPNGVFRALAIVRHSTPGKGMGVQFVKMSQEDRVNLNQFLSRHPVSQEDSIVAPANSASANSQLAISPRGGEATQLEFEREVRRLVELTGKGTYYQLLGATPESPHSQIKKSYYSLARQFHPDNHTGDRQLTASLVDLMTVITDAYKTLDNKEKRTAYDKRLAATDSFSMHRGNTGIEKSVAEWRKRANECLRAQNFAGSIVWLRKCLDAVPEQASYHAMLARSLGTLPQFHNEAIEHFRKAIDLDPWREPVYVQFAELFEKMQLPGRARAVYSKLLEINPTHARACERLAELEAEEKAEKPSVWISYLFGRKN